MWYKWIAVISSWDTHGCMIKNGTHVMCDNTYNFIQGGKQFTLYPKKSITTKERIKILFHQGNSSSTPCLKR